VSSRRIRELTTDTCSPERMYPCVYCADDDDDCSDHCVSFTAEVVPYDTFTAGTIESEYWDVVYGDEADEMIYWCGRTYDWAIAVKEAAVATQNLTYFGQSCGEFEITYTVTDGNGNEGTGYQNLWTVDTDDPDIEVSLASSSSSSLFSMNTLMGISMLVVGSVVIVGLVLRKRRQQYEPIPF